MGLLEPLREMPWWAAILSAAIGWFCYVFGPAVAHRVERAGRGSWATGRIFAAFSGVQRDAPLQHVLHFILRGTWPLTDAPVLTGELALHRDGEFRRGSDALYQIRQLARDGDLRIWAKPYNPGFGHHEYDVFSPLDKDYWEEHEFDLGCVLAQALNGVRTQHKGNVPEPRYGLHCALMLSKAEFATAWKRKGKPI